MKTLLIILFSLFLYKDIVIANIPIVLHNTIEVTATCYQPLSSQCDESPLITADGSKIDLNNPYKHKWVAISRDLLKTSLKFGDSIVVQNAGKFDGVWVVRDVMNKRFKKKIDFLVGDKQGLGRWDGVKIRIKN